MGWKKLAMIGLVALSVLAYMFAGGRELLDPRTFQAHYLEAPVATSCVFFVVCFLGTALSMPVTGVLAVIAGMTFGHALGLGLTLLACTCGGSLAFLMSRYVLHAPVQQRFADQLVQINKGIEADGAFYIFGLRMIPVVPFWLLNLLAALTPLDLRRFFLATMGGMFPLLLLLVHFGTQVQSVDELSPTALLNPGLLLSLGLLAALPFATRATLRYIGRRFR